MTEPHPTRGTPRDPIEGGETLLRDLAPQVLAALIRRFRDFPAAEDALQEALIAASLQWRRDGLPTNPRAWLIRVAARRLTDHIRSESARRRREAEAGNQSESFAPELAIVTDPFQDDTLVLLFMCCHESLPPSSAIALTLRALGGLTTAEIARAFLVPEATMAQRISRAKQTIRESGVPFALPLGAERSRRLGSVMHVLYLMFNEGYVATSGAHLQRPDLTREAIRLARILHHLMPDETEASGLLALMLLTDARRAARTGPNEELIPLDRQDRSRWNATAIAEGKAILAAALTQRAFGPYQVQAAISAVHCEAPAADSTDWPQILALYELLLGISDNPVVRLNHAIAVAMVRGPQAGLALLDALAPKPRLANNHRLHAARAHLLEMSGNFSAAATHYRRAAALTASQPEQIYLLTQAARLESFATTPT